MIKTAVIIAAGAGSRLRNQRNQTPKPLRKVGGIPLIKRIILSAQRAGITRVVVVVGYQKEALIDAVEKMDLPVVVEFVENDEWQKPNGLSVLKAGEIVTEKFVLLMSDHIFDWRALKKLCAQPLGDQEIILATDRRIDEVFDLDDATKVFEKDGKIVDIHKELKSYNSIDTGMFACSPHLFSVLKGLGNSSDLSLSKGIKKLANEKKAKTWDVGGAFWQDVDTPPALVFAENLLLEQCRKSTDGVIATWMNRPISTFITKQLARFSIPPNALTILTTLIGLLASYYVSFASYGYALWGAFLFHFSSLLDGCDGEMARLTMRESRFGEWLDTITDNLTYLCFFIGVSVGLYRMEDPYLWIGGPLLLIGVSLTLGVMFYFLVSYTTSGSLTALQLHFAKLGQTNFFYRFLKKINFLVKRDFFAFFFLICAFFGRLDFILWSAAIGANLMWLVLLHYRFLAPKTDPALVKEGAPSHFKS